MLGLLAKIKVVGINPEFLQRDDIVRRRCASYPKRDLVETGHAVFGNVFQLPLSA